MRGLFVLDYFLSAVGVRSPGIFLQLAEGLQLRLSFRHSTQSPKGLREQKMGARFNRISFGGGLEIRRRLLIPVQFHQRLSAIRQCVRETGTEGKRFVESEQGLVRIAVLQKNHIPHLPFSHATCWIYSQFRLELLRSRI